MDKAVVYFERSKDFDFQSLYMLSIMLYDGIGCKPDTVSHFCTSMLRTCHNDLIKLSKQGLTVQHVVLLIYSKGRDTVLTIGDMCTPVWYSFRVICYRNVLIYVPGCPSAVHPSVGNFISLKPIEQNWNSWAKMLTALSQCAEHRFQLVWIKVCQYIFAISIL